MARKWMKQKRFLSLLLSAAMLITAAAPVAVRAEEVKDETEGGTVEISYDETAEYITNSSEDLPDNDELFVAYVDSLFFGDSSISAYGNFGESRLDGVNLAAYKALKAKIEQIAAGEVESTKIALSLEDLGITQNGWTAADLGVDAIIADNAITAEAKTALEEKILPDMGLLLDYLLLDCPMDLYWFDKEKGIATSFGFSARGNGEEYVLMLNPEQVTYSFHVASDYSAGEYTVNISLAGIAKAAAENAKDIVTKHADKEDNEKLAAYKQEICDLVSYNTSAANGSTSYGNPWQLIWVFDGDNTTNVVCEGYSKAFQYLCDLSEFESAEVNSYIVSGFMNGGTGAGAHMWNVVTMEDKKNYIVDVTNCDTGTIGAEDQLFLAGASGNAASGYTVACSGANVIYAYDNNMTAIYGDILNISDSRYCSHEWEYMIDQNPTCQKEGSQSAVCHLCGAEKTETIPKAEHSYGEWEIVTAATCIEAGSRQRICTVCKETDTETIAVTDHTLVKTEAKEATCTQAGNIAYYTCSVCHKIFSDETGTTEITEEDTVITATHSYGEWIVIKAPTCTETGSRQRICTVCGAEDTETIAATGHDWETVTEAATCTADGSTYDKCSVCGIETNERILPAIDHDWKTVAEEAATCTKDGSRHKICTICEAEDEEILHAVGHDWETITVNATCTTDGSTYRKCNECGEEEERQILSALGHTLVKTEAKAATCTASGNIAYYTCTACGKIYQDAAAKTEISQSQTVIAKKDHTYQTVTTKATTSANGSTTEKCSACGNVSKTSVIYYPKTVQLAKTACTYTGKAITPAVTVKSSSGGTISAADYTVAYKNNKAVGTASVTITFRGNYTGTITKTFAINPKGTSLKKLKASSKGFTASWKKLTTQTNGYEIQYGTSKKVKGAKILDIRKNKTISAKVSKLKAKKTYYVRIRTYKKVNGKKYYSAWSAYKKIITK